MIVTAGEIVRDALMELTVQSNERTVPPVDMQTGLRYLNRMMAALDAKGVKLGFTFVQKPNDVVTVSAGAIEGMVFNLAVRLGNGFDVPISASLASLASESLKTMYQLGVSLGRVGFPTTLPVGSGNECDAEDRHFYAGPCDPAPSNCGDSNGCGSSGSGGAYGTPIIQSPTAPENPSVGTLWLDTSEEL